MWMAKHVCVSVVVLGVLCAGIPQAQAQSDQQESVADAARRSREQKKEVGKPATVITNDTLEPPKAEAPAGPTAPAAAPPAATATTEVNASPAAPATSSTTTAAPGGEQQAAGPAAPPAGGTSDEQAAKSRGLEALKQQIQELQSEVDLLQRQEALANDDFYSHPDFSKDEEGKAKLDAMKNDLAQKLDELSQLKTKLPAGTDLKEEKPVQTESPSEPPAESQSQSQAQP